MIPQWLRAQTVLLEDLSQFSSIHVGRVTVPASGDPMPSSGVHGHSIGMYTLPHNAYM